MTGIGLALAATGISGIARGQLSGFVDRALLMMPGYMLGATGAGDVKLMAAVGAVVGPVLVITAFLFTAIAGGVLAVSRGGAGAAGSPRPSPDRAADRFAPAGARQEIRRRVRRTDLHTGQRSRSAACSRLWSGEMPFGGADAASSF
jgi:hypothetical protein